MIKLRVILVLNICVLISLLVLYHAKLPQHSANNKKSTDEAKDELEYPHTQGAVGVINSDYNIWLIFTKVTNVSTLSYKFNSLLHNLINISSVPLNFNIIVDRGSQKIAENQIADLTLTNKTMTFNFYDIEESAKTLQDIVEVMTPHFSSRPGDQHFMKY